MTFTERNQRKVLLIDPGRWLVNFLTKYWIFVSCGMLLLVSIQNTVVMYRIIYMVFYLFFILSFQVRIAWTDHLSIPRSSLDLLWILEKNRGYISSDYHYLFDDHSHRYLHLSGQPLHFEIFSSRHSWLSFQFEKVQVFLSARFSEDL